MIAQAIWMMWLGGLTFYIAFVVPIGGEVIGAAQQGEITGRVTAIYQCAWYSCFLGDRMRGLAAKR